MSELPKTIFCDIDGTIFDYSSRDLFRQVNPEYIPPVLPGAIDALRRWESKGYKIILTTGRKESARQITEEQLRKHSIIYDQLIMGVGGGVRVLINDKKPDSEVATAVAIVVERNKGLENITI